MFSAHGWVGQGKLQIISSFLAAAADAMIFQLFLIK
jgi:hypothetical protein